MRDDKGMENLVYVIFVPFILVLVACTSSSSGVLVQAPSSVALSNAQAYLAP